MPETGRFIIFFSWGFDPLSISTARGWRQIPTGWSDRPTLHECTNFGVTKGQGQGFRIGVQLKISPGAVAEHYSSRPMNIISPPKHHYIAWSMGETKSEDVLRTRPPEYGRKQRLNSTVTKQLRATLRITRTANSVRVQYHCLIGVMLTYNMIQRAGIDAPSNPHLHMANRTCREQPSKPSTSRCALDQHGHLSTATCQLYIVWPRRGWHRQSTHGGRAMKFPITLISQDFV